jgi:hypothetical protein
MQITITGLLFNSQDGLVSQGITVKFTDMTDAGVSAGGAFSPPVANIDSSKAMTLYFPPLLPSGSMTGNYITITANALDANSNPIGRPGKTRIFVSP